MVAEAREEDEERGESGGGGGVLATVVGMEIEMGVVMKMTATLHMNLLPRMALMVVLR